MNAFRPGSGCLSVHLLQQLQKRQQVQCLPSCLLIDINPKAVTAALNTAACNGVGQHFDGLQGDLFSAIRLRQTFDMMLFNPVSEYMRAHCTALPACILSALSQ